jgi:hypothetical protein
MTLQQPRTYGLDDLMSDWGYDTIDQLMADAITDSVCPGICRTCGYSTEIEPDNSQGWCEECETPTVVSALRLMGVI